MEALGGLIVLFLLFGGLGLVIRALRAFGRAALGKGSLADNLEATFKGMGPLQLRFMDQRLGDKGEGPLMKVIQVKGLFPVSYRRTVEFCTSVFDNTSGKYEPIAAALEMYQEKKTIAYQYKVALGPVNPQSGFIGWVNVGAVLPEILQTPYGGKRSLVAVLRLLDVDKNSTITNGFHETDDAAIVWQQKIEFEYTVEGRGYLEMADLRDEARLICVKVALGIAMWNGSLSDEEGSAIKSWIQKVLTSTPTDRCDRLKASFNQTMREAYSSAKSGTLGMRSLMARLNEIGDKAVKYETVELCFDLMAMRRELGTAKARVIDLISKALELDVAEYEKIRDAKIVSAAPDVTQGTRIEGLLGIDPTWGKDQIRKHLRTEFQKWNNRLSSLPEGIERDNAQRMLDAISEARKRYG